MNITDKNKKELIDKGWTLVNMGLSEKEIHNYKCSLIKLRDKAYKIKYPLRRCYYPHLSSRNIAAIESPFNNLIINEGVKELIKRIELGKTLSKLMGWEYVYLQLARLFTMKKYKFMGDWHIDIEDWDGEIVNMETIQVGIYLKDQDGFRIIKPSLNEKALETRYIRNPHLPIKLPKNYYSEIKGEAGSVLFFAPGLLHQGNSTSERLDFHLRFSNNIGKENRLNYLKSETSLSDFIVPDVYSEDFDISKDLYSPRHSKISNYRRLKNSINYYTGLFNFYRQLKYLNQKKALKNKANDFNIFANTIYQ